MFHLLPEPFLESVPQVHIILMVTIGSYATTVDPEAPLAIATFSLSVLSAAFGITKFFSVGPCRLIPYDKMNLGFFLLMLNVASCLVGKGALLASSTAGPSGRNNYGYKIGLWVSLSIVPQVVFVSIWYVIPIVILYKSRGWATSISALHNRHIWVGINEELKVHDIKLCVYDIIFVCFIIIWTNY